VAGAVATALLRLWLLLLRWRRRSGALLLLLRAQIGWLRLRALLATCLDALSPSAAPVATTPRPRGARGGVAGARGRACARPSAVLEGRLRCLHLSRHLAKPLWELRRAALHAVRERTGCPLTTWLIDAARHLSWGSALRLPVRGAAAAGAQTSVRGRCQVPRARSCNVVAG
jgi:hypothetical protein